MKLRKRELVLLIAAPALLLGAIGSIGGMQAAAKANEVAAADQSITKTATYEIQSTTSVTPTGEAPKNSTAKYSQTYKGNAGQMTAGNSTTFTLSGYDGLTIKAITLSMKSNTKGGTGQCIIKVGNELIADSGEKAFNNNFFDSGKNWSTSYKDVHAKLDYNPKVGKGEDIVVTINASANSLYIQSYKIDYEEESTPETFESALKANETEAKLSFDYNYATAEGGTTTTTFPDGSWGSDATQTKHTFKVGEVEIVCSQSRMDDTYIRIYSGSTTTIKAPSNITKIVFNFKSGSNLTAKEGTYESGTWTGSATSVVFTAGEQIRINDIEVTYEGGTTTTYSNFNNVQMHFRYNFEGLKDTEVFTAGLANATAKGLVVTNNADFKFETTESFGEAKDSIFKTYTNEETKAGDNTYTVGIAIPEGKYEVTLRAAAYVLLDGKYYFNTPKEYSVAKMLEEYADAECKETTDEQKAICEAFSKTIKA